jgi:NAD(P) transhydrogenase subunit alpha
MSAATIGVLSGADRRVPLVPEGAKRLIRNGLSVMIETGAGTGAHHSDAAYESAGAVMAARNVVLDKGDVLLSVTRPATAELDRLRAGQGLVGLLDFQSDPGVFEGLGRRGVVAVSLERLPRTLSRAQTMDVLTSQASVAGYRAVLVAAHAYTRYLPMLITAAGTSRPARVLVLGAGVAGLSAIGTARRLGAIVTGYDVRPESKVEIESLGGRFLELKSVTDAAGEGGYARALTEDEQRAQQAELVEALGSFDMVITTAAVPGRRPPLLVPAAGLARLGAGSVVVDLACGALGGNVEGSRSDQWVETEGGVTVIGVANAAADVPAAASDALSSNFSAVVGSLIKDGRLTIDPADEIHAAIVVAGWPSEGNRGARIPAV